MEEEKVVVTKPVRNHFNIRYFEKWEEFRNTWKSVPFDEKLNNMDDEALTLFWKEQLDILNVETEKVCILVPLKVNKIQEKKMEAPEINEAVNGQIEKS